MVGESEDRARTIGILPSHRNVIPLADDGEAEVLGGPDDVPGWGVNGEFGN